MRPIQELLATPCVGPLCKRLLVGGCAQFCLPAPACTTLQAADELELCGHGDQHAGHGGWPGPALPQRCACRCCLLPACSLAPGWVARPWSLRLAVAAGLPIPPCSHTPGAAHPSPPPLPGPVPCPCCACRSDWPHCPGGHPGVHPFICHRRRPRARPAGPRNHGSQDQGCAAGLGWGGAALGWAALS